MEEKSIPPMTRLEFLGNMVDSQKMMLEVSKEKRQELMTLLTKWKSKHRYRKKEIQSLIGKLCHELCKSWTYFHLKTN